MNKANFTAQPNFPVSTFTYDFLKNMAQLAGQMAQLGGNNYILSGCVEITGSVGDGFIVINGEILPFQGGQIKNKVIIEETTIDEHFAGVDYPEAYINRVAKLSDTGNHNWADFVRVLTNQQLKQAIDNIKGDAPGIVKMWAGLIAKIPEDYKLCDGTSLLIADYPELYDKIDSTFGGNSVSFNLPNLKNRFIAGYDTDKTDYNAIGKTGGEEKHTLSVNEMPEHKHIVPWGENLNSAWTPEWGYPSGYFNNSRGYKADTDNDNTWPYTSPTGSGSPHENRPPYFTLAYIIKVK